MTELEQYNAMTKEVQILIDDCIANQDFAEDCLVTLLSICPERECSLRALVEAYADYKHEQLTLEAQLKKFGIDHETAYKLGMMKRIAEKDN